MKTTNFLLLIVCLLFFQISWSQLVEIHGKIVSDEIELENINIYNSTSKKGSITNKSGEFVLLAKENDVIKISALYLKEVVVVIDAEILKNKKFTILVKEEVNALDEVVILSHNLTGELLVDVDNSDYFKPIPIDIGNMDNLDFEDIRMNKLDNVILKKGQLYNGFNPVEILKLFGVSFKKKKKPNYQELKDRDAKQISDLADVYSPKYIHENFNIPYSKIEAFHAFLEVNQIDYALFKKENEVQLLEYLLVQSKLFLKKGDAKN